MKIVLIIYVISWLMMLGATVVRIIINRRKFFKQFSWYYYLKLFALAPFYTLFIVLVWSLYLITKLQKSKVETDNVVLG